VVRSSYLEQPVGVFLDALAADTPTPAGGSAAALAVAQSAALCMMTARLSVRTLSAERADGLISRAAISHAADVPLRIVELAVQVVKLAAALASEGNQALRGDAITARLLAQAGGRAAAELVRINLASTPADPRIARADQLIDELADPLANQG